MVVIILSTLFYVSDGRKNAKNDISGTGECDSPIPDMFCFVELCVRTGRLHTLFLPVYISVWSRCPFSVVVLSARDGQKYFTSSPSSSLMMRFVSRDVP